MGPGSLPPDSGVVESAKPGIDLLFSGDIMAHESNYLMKDYGNIYGGIRTVLDSAELSFGNLEMPVADSLPLSTYPRFNVHSPYVAAAVTGGFDVFSLANNHSNDQGARGIAGTLSFMNMLSPGIVSSGLRSAPGEAMKPVLIERNGWKILFLAVTEILNSHDSSKSLVYLIGTKTSDRKQFCAELARMREENPCDIFVLSIHLNEEEYIRTVSSRKREWFASLADSGVDIVWGHHPHVMQEWQVHHSLERARDALFMYSMGNFISGQRTSPEYGNPDGYREYTGDAVLLRVRVLRTGDSSGCRFTVEPIPVTNYVDPSQGIVVRRFDREFVDSLGVRQRMYYLARYSLMKSYLPLLPLSPDPTILE